jgi:hypothetical protein
MTDPCGRWTPARRHHRDLPDRPPDRDGTGVGSHCFGGPGRHGLPHDRGPQHGGPGSLVFSVTGCDTGRFTLDLASWPARSPRGLTTFRVCFIPDGAGGQLRVGGGGGSPSSFRSGGRTTAVSGARGKPVPGGHSQPLRAPGSARFSFGALRVQVMFDSQGRRVLTPRRCAAAGTTGALGRDGRAEQWRPGESLHPDRDRLQERRQRVLKLR